MKNPLNSEYERDTLTPFPLNNALKRIYNPQN